MATSTNAATAIVSDAELKQQIEALDSVFYGADEVSVGRSLRTSMYDDSEDEYLSPTEDETDVRSSIGQVSAPTGAPSGSSMLCDNEAAVIASEFENGCGCKEECYRQFTVDEICEFRLSMKELDKHERDLFLMGKLQTLLKDPSTVTHARSAKPVATKKQRCRVAYAFDHRIICQHAYCFIHDIGNYALLSSTYLKLDPAPPNMAPKVEKLTMHIPLTSCRMLLSS